jgi:hypothetical protein
MEIMKHEEHRLLNIEAASQLLAEANTIEEVTEIRNYAEAVRLVARQAKAGLQVQNQAAEIKLRAERRAGEMLASIKRAKNQHDAHHSDDKQTYSQIVKEHIGHGQIAHNWQRIAAIPERDFEQHIQTTKDNQEELTTAGTVRVAKAKDAQENAQQHNNRMTNIMPSEWDRSPAAKTLLYIVMKTWPSDIARWKKSVALGKLSPEAQRFFAKQLRNHIERVQSWIEILENAE